MLKLQKIKYFNSIRKILINIKMIYIIISEQNKYYNLIKNEQNEEKVFIHSRVYHE